MNTKNLMIRKNEMMSFRRKFNAPIFINLFCLALFSQVAFGDGYIEMPKTLEVPTFEKDSMLLDLDVPPLRERDPDPQGGPRLNVTEFRLQGVVEYPELGITRESLIKRVEAIRFELMKQDEIGKWGYTEQEVGEIANMMVDIESGIQDQHVGPLEVQKLVFLVREQRRKRGVTLGMIELVADEITQFYREKGFILAKAYIPEQKIRDGIVTLTLLLGELGSVTLPDEKRVSSSLLNRAFAPHIHQPVTSKRLEEALYLVNDIPGLRARSALAPGRQVGDTDLNMAIQSEKWYSGNVRIDNFGSENTSKNRFYTDVYIHNPSGMGDEIYFGLLNTFSPDNSTFAAFRYSSFFGLPRLRTNFGYSTNEFISSEVQSNSENKEPLFIGDSEVSDISIDYVFSRFRVKNVTGGIQYTKIDTSLDVLGESKGSVQKTSLNLKYHFLNQKRRHLYLGSMGLHSVDALEETFDAGLRNISYMILTSNFSMLSFPKFPFTNKETRMLFSLSAQYSGESTSNVTQFNLAGVGRVRSFSVNGSQGDDALFAGVDWIFSLPKFKNAKFFGESYHTVFQPYIFASYGYGKIYEISTDDVASDVTIFSNLADAGFGVKINYAGVSANMFYGQALVDDISIGDDPTPTSNFNMELSYSF